MVTRRDQLASKAKKENEPRKGRGRGKTKGRGKGRGRGRGRGNRAEPAVVEDECDDGDDEMEGGDCENGEGCENGEKGEVESVELRKVPEKLRPFVAPSRAAPSTKPSTSSRASSSKTKPSAKAKTASKPKDSRAKKEPKDSCESSSRAKKEPKGSSKSKKEPKTSRASEDKGTEKVCLADDGGEPMESKENKSKSKPPKNKKADKKRSIPENDSSRPVARSRKGRSMPAIEGKLEREIKEIQSFTEALDYHNLEFDDLKFYTKEALTQQFEFELTQLNIYWKTARCGIRMSRADGKVCDPFSFTFPADSGGHLLRMVVAVAAAAHMVTSLNLYQQELFFAS